MSLQFRIRVSLPTGKTFYFSAEKLTTGELFNFQAMKWEATSSPSWSHIGVVKERANSLFKGEFASDFAPQFSDMFDPGFYKIAIHDPSASNRVVQEVIVPHRIGELVQSVPIDINSLSSSIAAQVIAGMPKVTPTTSGSPQLVGLTLQGPLTLSATSPTPTPTSSAQKQKTLPRAVLEAHRRQSEALRKAMGR